LSFQPALTKLKIQIFLLDFSDSSYGKLILILMFFLLLITDLLDSVLKMFASQERLDVSYFWKVTNKDNQK